jgi:hypothetical protein
MALEFLESKGWLHYGKTKPRKARISLYLCECGNTFIAREDNVANGNTTSCGCTRKKKHKYVSHPMYQSWAHLKQRCNNPSNKAYRRYGGRGITYQDSWEDFRGFLEDMGDTWFEGGTIDRIDNNKDYSKYNCQWLTRADNARKGGRNFG